MKRVVIKCAIKNCESNKRGHCTREEIYLDKHEPTGYAICVFQYTLKPKEASS